MFVCVCACVSVCMRVRACQQRPIQIKRNLPKSPPRDFARKSEVRGVCQKRPILTLKRHVKETYLLSFSHTRGT